MTTNEMKQQASEYANMNLPQKMKLTEEQGKLLMIWELAGDLSRKFREYPTMELPTDDEIATLYASDLPSAVAAVDRLNAKYRSGYHHSAIIAGVAHQLGIRR